MKLLIPFLFFTLLCTHALAQNYQCVHPGVKRYYTNSGHYLRGMRIDSVKQVGNASMLYPFYSPRGKYGLNQTPPYLDSTGGSWLGKTITILPDGTHWFANSWGDTVVVKAQATLFEKWKLYTDSSAIWYEAEVVAIDTATVLGMNDSVKVIAVTAYDNNGMINTPASGARIVISKYNGFAEVPDIYMFPYHEKGKTTYAQEYDYFLDRYGQYMNGVSNFKPVQFVNATRKEIYDFEVGDVFLTEATHMALIEYHLDSVISKMANGNGVTYVYSRRSMKRNRALPPPASDWVYSSSLHTGSANDAYIMSTDLMPEEWGNPMSYYYNPNDMELCSRGRSYSVIDNFINYNIGVINTFEPCGKGSTQKTGFGMTNYFECFNPPVDVFQEQLIAVVKNGKECGANIKATLGVQDISFDYKTRIFPNPVSNELTIELPQGNDVYTVYIRDVAGREVAAMSAVAGANKVDVSAMPDGLYLLYITNGQGLYTIEKLMVQH